MTTQMWSSEGYAKNARFVTDLGTPVLELLAPRPGEHILDVGCGDGVLTKKIADAVIGRVARALLPNGRFVAEMGGHGCVKTLLAALIEELESRGHDGQAANPWYFPTVEDYGGRLAAAGFDVSYIALIPRPTPLPGDVMEWLTTFCGCFAAVLPEGDRADYLECVRERIKPYLCDATGKWTADYVRLRFAAHLAC